MTHPAPGGPWLAPTETERLLHEAAVLRDVPAQLRVLSGADLFVGMPRHELAADPRTIRFQRYWDPAVRAYCLPVLTRGMLPAWQPDWVFVECDLSWLSGGSWPEGSPWLVVDGGTPAAAYLEAGPRHRALWRRAYAENERSRCNKLIGLRHGPLHGPLAFGLGCGGHLAVGNGVPWNEVGTLYRGYVWDAKCLRDSWDITTREGWQQQLGHLLDAENSPPEPDFVLAAREALRDQSGGAPPPADVWREYAAGTAQDRGVSPATVRGIEELVRRVVRYEARFRADALLPPDGRVGTTVAYDYGRAVNLARWGLGARFAHPQEAEQAIVHAGALSRAAYSSWEEFSAGYVLGRVLRFDGEEYGSYYADALEAHRLLLSDEGSPWRNLRWR
ncbi:DUF1266 domain-containing protein [Streptomyces sp. H27-D2]|uniref:DUF1266 domain-containing protein n=1 Tax=Streptomyces sp. H27-D2 TaxID=3046304 RepID=UPI002DBBCB5B|nr:DUF1266 domain-containing protein [Streptomyces sp. H27-D2]MEC4020370.1 DUF1266 domain-containing protein [Streptomyces sp. H27-D2]